MRKIKDFFHDSNDVLLAVMIILIAVGLIGWRLMVILDYPDKLAAKEAAKSAKQTEQQAKESKKTKSTTEKTENEETAEDGGVTGTGDGSSAENAAG